MKNTIIHKILACLCLFLLFSCEEVLLEQDISDESVNILAPANNAQFFSTSINFSWEPVENATSYRLQIAKPNFTDPLQLVVDEEITETSFTQQLNIGQYEWRIKAINSGYQTSYITRSFEVVSNTDFQNNTVVLTAPVNNLITKNATQNLTWNSVIGASSYQIQILNSGNAITHDQTVTTTNLSYSFVEGSYQWRVRASNSNDYTLYTTRNILVDTTSPNTPSLVSPSNASAQSNGEINFTWNRLPISGSTEKDSIYIYSNSNLTNLRSKNQSNSPYTETLPNGTFYWYVKSFDEAGNVSAQSSVFNVILN